MKPEISINEKGFSLVELLVSLALGLLVLGATVRLFKSGVDASVLVSQRAEMQQNARAAINLLTKDISMAGAGLPTGGIQLPTGGPATNSQYACDQQGTCYLPNHQYPNGNYMYGLIPGPNNGVQNGALIPDTNQSADSITVAYLDYAFPLNQYTCVVSSSSTITLTPPVPAPVPALPAINAPGVGLRPGELVMVVGGNIATIVAEVTDVSPTTITFSDADPLNLNNSGGDPIIGNLGYIFNRSVAPPAGQGNCTATRLLAVTYFLQVPAGGQSPRLMRQVSGLTPVPVADDIIGMTVSYDLFNDTTGLNNAQQRDPLAIAGVTPNQIRKVNIAVRAQSLAQGGFRRQSMQLATSISARNMSFRNRYQ
jgi:prepilin-type N-terminal cleavage/methylation domain-containing protein